MPKPTSPQPPGLTDEEVNALAEVYIDEDVTWESCERLARAAFAAGCAAQRRVDAEIARGFKKIQPATTRSAHVCIEWTAEEIAAAIERTPEQPTTQRCPTCISGLRHHRNNVMENGNIPIANPERGTPCTDPFHSQPTTGEVGQLAKMGSQDDE